LSKNKLAIAIAIGALSLTGCSVAPSATGTTSPSVAADPAAGAAAPASYARGAAATTVVPASYLTTASTDKQAATSLRWGRVLAGDEFSRAGAPDATKWSVYKGSGHAGKGVRSAKAWSVANGVATVKGDSAGTTGGMSAKFGRQKYGRWETRMRTSARAPQYHPVLILWPNSSTGPKCSEIDYAEGTSDTTKMKFFLHYACGGSSSQTTMAKAVDTTQWHNYAVEWTPSGITGYIDGVKTFTDTNRAHLPSVAMHQTLQLDWFPNGARTTPSQMQVDWVRVYK
jgi:hypothetical protein